MKKIKKEVLTIFLLVGIFTALLPTAGVAAGFSDVSGHWAEGAIYRWTDNGVIKGYTDGTFKPDQPVSRAELAAIINRLLDYPVPEYSVSGMDITSWYYQDVAALLDMRFIYAPNGEYTAHCTREEAVYMIGKAFAIGQGVISNKKSFTDEDSIAGYARSLAIDMKYERFISGYPDGSFGPQRPITRAEIITILDNMIVEIIDKPGSYTYESASRVLVKSSDVKIKLVNTPDAKYGYSIKLFVPPSIDTEGAIVVDTDPQCNVKAYHVGTEKKVVTYPESSFNHMVFKLIANRTFKTVSGESPEMERMAIAMGSMLNYRNSQQILFGEMTHMINLPTSFFLTPRGADALNSSWGIYNHDQLVETIWKHITGNGQNALYFMDAAEVASMTDEQIVANTQFYIDGYMFTQLRDWNNKWGDTGLVTWDLFRVANLIMWGYNAGYISYDEAMELMEPTAAELSKYFDTWDEAYDNYLDGHAWWSRSDISEERPREDDWLRIRAFFPDVFDDALLSS